MTKKCFKCNQYKDISFFYKHKDMKDGHLNKCKYCTKKDVRRRYYDPESRKKIKEYEKERNQRPSRKEKKLEYERKRRKKYIGKYKANCAVRNAIRNGELKRQPCDICGDKKSEAHHFDYRKKIEVRWLCFKHHREEHGQKIY